MMLGICGAAFGLASGERAAPPVVPWGGLPVCPGVCIGPLLVFPVPLESPGLPLTDGEVID
jgi:hypothetical protein